MKPILTADVKVILKLESKGPGKADKYHFVFPFITVNLAFQSAVGRTQGKPS